jgi:putative ABC transport system ATP-binding protein
VVSELRIRDLTIEYSQGDYVVRPIDGLDVTCPSGELVLLLGPSGSGKTTLLSCLAGLLRPTRGTITVGDTEVTALDGSALTGYRRHRVGIVFQAFNLIPSLTARENVMAPLRLAGIRRREAGAAADALIERVGLTERAHHRPRQLSGGQQQRVAIARSLVHDPPLIVADEPTAHLDYVQVEAVLRLIRDLAAPGRSVVVATHDDRFTPLADRVIELAPRSAPGEGVSSEIRLGTGEVLFEQGEPGQLVYVVEQGAVELYRERPDGEVHVVGRAGPGDYFGELAPLLKLPRSASARAAVPTRLTGYSLRDFRSWQTRTGAAG